MEGSSFPVQYLVNLEYLDVSSNRFHGKFPVKELMKLKHLKGLDLSDNFFNDTMEGALPFFNFTHDLVHLQISENMFSSHLPENVNYQEVTHKLYQYDVFEAIR
ncbi:putative kinase-like protein TMKL1 isoform X3 [Durio zibethinus]|uniref:Kinase-like protein TMKL1 isoform X3 n=1 Tax=Durio zibethinus TaxID=66656 RepID=A0A6P5WFS2_DURZI|nr:putative kinase-like protein TMKL1 isoform X3 [Durio zibethinus]